VTALVAKADDATVDVPVPDPAVVPEWPGAAGFPPVGDPAPEIELTDQHGSAYSLSRARLDGPVLVVFFPFAFSGVCTGEMAGLVDLHDDLAALGTSIVAVSCDQLFALRVFSDQLSLPFPVLSDFWPHGSVARSFGVFDAERGCSVRGSFLVDADGLLQWSVVNPIGAVRDLGAHVAAAQELAARPGR
jgi:peroxiredoxin